MLKPNIPKLFFPLFVLAYFTIPVFGEQVPSPVIQVETDPYYFSEGGLGIEILKYFDRSLSPYLVPGKTTDDSSPEEINDAYLESSRSISQKIIVADNNRAMAYVVEFSGGDLQKTLRFDTFQKFTHISKNQKNSPYYYQNIQYGLELESLPSKDKKIFYDDLVIPSINPGKKPEPFDIQVRILSGDGYTIQTWKYQKCIINSYTPYLDENLSKIKFTGEFAPEIREKTAFGCDGFLEDFVLKEPNKSDLSLNHVVPKEDRAERITVQFSGGDLQNIATFYSFSKFAPISQNPAFPISIPGNVIGEKPRFTLESLPTTDKGKYYEFLSRYVNPGALPQPFDATIHLIAGNNMTLQIWQYKDCIANNHMIFFTDNLLLYKFKQSMGSEIRDKTYFECAGLSLNKDFNKTRVDTKQTILINDRNRAQMFVVHFQGADITPERTVSSFVKFSPITHEELRFLVPNSPFGKEPKFYLESLPSKDNEWYYHLMSEYINSGKIPDPFDVTVDILTGDGTRLQRLEYTDCQVLEYKTYLEDVLFVRAFTNEFEKEFRDRTIFQCVGLVFDGISYKPKVLPEKTLDYIDFIPSEQSRITRVVATLSGGDLMEPIKINTIGKFTPKIEQRSQTQTQFVEFSTTIIPNQDSGAGISTSGPPDYCEPGQKPPGCRPCPPNSPHCPDSPPIDPEEPPIDPEEPGISTPTYTTLATMPHLSVTQRNDYIKSTEFTLLSLPSKDKLPYYDIVSKYINPGKKPEPFDVTLDYLSYDGTIIQSWKYADCGIKDFKIKRNDVLILQSLSDIKGAADIVEQSTLACNGFSVVFDQQKTDSQYVVITPTPYDRAMLNLVHWYGGELQNQRTTALLQEFNTQSNSNLSVGGLPNIYHKDGYQFISRYFNPGKTPEPIDMRFDTMTGDGTILFSIIYHDCTVDDASVYRADNMALIHYTSGLKPEIRGKSVIDCVGTSFKVSPKNDPKFTQSENMRKISPITQSSLGIASENISCNEDSTLMIRPPNNIPVCIKDDGVSKLEERGWKIPSNIEKKKLVDVLGPILPLDSQRAMSFTIHFEGTDISPTQTVDTFSKFVPITDANSIVLIPSNPVVASSKEFYLESLPSKDKSWYYDLASRYVNPGAKPEPFNITIDIKIGNGDVLQKWNYHECEIIEFVTYYDDNLLLYKFHEKTQSELKDKSIFRCSGLSIDSSLTE